MALENQSRKLPLCIFFDPLFRRLRNYMDYEEELYIGDSYPYNHFYDFEEININIGNYPAEEAFEAIQSVLDLINEVEGLGPNVLRNVTINNSSADRRLILSHGKQIEKRYKSIVVELNYYKETLASIKKRVAEDARCENDRDNAGDPTAKLEARLSVEFITMFFKIINEFDKEDKIINYPKGKKKQLYRTIAATFSSVNTEQFEPTTVEKYYNSPPSKSALQYWTKKFERLHELSEDEEYKLNYKIQRQK